jgi:hypothetical protein
MRDMPLACLYCSGDPFEPDHASHCDGRQGGRAEDMPAPAIDRYQSREARDAGIALVDDAASEAFRVAADAAIETVARSRPRFVVDDVWAVRSQWPWTRDKRAMGPAIRRAVGRAVIAATDDYQPTGQVRSHSSYTRIWRSLICPQ